MQRALEFGKKQAGSRGGRLERVILHLDLDCFYCQVEQVRLGIPTSVPFAVQQWDKIIAVNYAARTASVTRHDNYRECFAHCAELRLVHVPTFNTAHPAAGIHAYKDTGKEDTMSLDRATHKASLQPYREASMKIFFSLRNALTSYGAPFVVEKASVDEVFLDVSEIVDRLLTERFALPIHRGKLAEDYSPSNSFDLDWSDRGKPAISKDGLDDNVKEYELADLRIHLGCEIALRIRQVIFDELSYTASAGIAHNKTLAKLASARHKPDQQTFVLKRHVTEWMKQVPFHKIRFLGGKLGKLLLKTLDKTQADLSDDEENGDPDEASDEEASISPEDPVTIMAADLWSLTVEDLQKKVGDKDSAKWVYNIIRGEDNTPVAPRLQGKSFMSAKNLPIPLKEWQQLSDWLVLLVSELSGRILEDFQTNSRWPHSITIHFKRPHERSKSRVLDFPFAPDQIPAKNHALAEICMNALGNENRESSIFPCSRLALAVGRFRPFIGNGKKRSLTMDEFLSREKRPFSIDQPPPRPKVETPCSNRATKKGITHYFPLLDDKKGIDGMGFDKKGIGEVGLDKKVCTKCSKSFDPFDEQGFQEHLDYHLALQLQKEIDESPP